MSAKESELKRKLKFQKEITRRQALLLDEYRETIKQQDRINNSLRIEKAKLKEGLIKIESLCDPENDSFCQVWNVANDLITK